MGRYNNRRTQAAAEALKNTPSRARFSKGPPNKNSKPKRNNNATNSNTTTAGKDNNNNNDPRRRQPPASTAARVIDKIQQNQQQKHQRPSLASSLSSSSAAAATTEQALIHLDKSKLDHLKLPPDILQNITLLLERLGVKETSTITRTRTRTRTRSTTTASTSTSTTASSAFPPVDEKENDNNDDAGDGDFMDEEDDEVENDETWATGQLLLSASASASPSVPSSTTTNLSASAKPFVARSSVSFGEYSEYDQDVVEEEEDEDEDEEEGEYDYDVDSSNNNDPTPSEDEMDNHNDEGEDDEPQRMKSRTSLMMGEENDWEGAGYNDDDDADDDDDDGSEDESSSSAEEDFQEHPAFIHLTQQLSFSEVDAKRACRAIQDWDAVVEESGADATATTKSTTTTTRNNVSKQKKETVTLAMDWLCLHLTEAQLLQGFRPNKNPTTQTNNKSLLLSKSGIPLVGASNIRAIPHPSISVATDIVSDKAWARSIRLQERTLKFVRLGFSHAEATKACQETSSTNETEDTALTKQTPLQDPALSILLSMLRSKLMAEMDNHHDMPDPDSLNDTDLEYAAEERQHEREALEAIYDDQLRVEMDSNTLLDRYLVQISPAEPLLEPARSEDCQLYVFLRRGYPVVETPLFWFSNPSLPPSLLRQINEFAAKQALENVGAPAVFDIVNSLTDALPELQLQFIRLQRRREFDAEQARIRKHGHTPNNINNNNNNTSLEQVVNAQYEGVKIGRRQRAKLKAAEKAYDRGDLQQQQEQERRKKQEERVQRAQQESSRVRAAYAKQALLKREQEKITEEAEQAARAAMNAAFNRGEGIENARKAADQARKQCLKKHGVATSDGEDDIPEESETTKNGSTTNEHTSHQSNNTRNGNPTAKTASFMDSLRETTEEAARKEESEATAATEHVTDNSNFAETTPQTVAFMERLRQMYDVAAKKKVGFHLVEPKQESRDQDEESLRAPAHTPRPVAVATGELGEVMADILKQQEEQPWLISPEARVPAMEDPVVDESLSLEQHKKQKEISKQLRQDLERKLKAAAAWGEKHEEKSKANGRGKPKGGSEAARYHAMLSVRQRLPAFNMAKEVVETIAANQITVIAGSTGCGKTTQVPQMVLDDRILKGLGAATNIIVTQPRRISAIGVSERIADERTEKVGETCGYSIKLEKRMSSKTRLLLCTTGVLLRRLQCDPDLASVSHIFVDEVHERDLNTDFLLIILKDLLARRKNLKLVLMSATLNSDAFSAYFSGCPIVSIPGRTHPVVENRLEDILELTSYQVLEHSDYAIKTDNSKPPKISKSALRKLYYPKYSKETIHSLSIVDETVINYELVAALLEHISLHQDEGAILVFMPGMMEITKTIEEMYKKELFQSDKVRIYPLHSSLSTSEQTAIFEVPPKGVRKIVVSTNIAETSITIEDVVYVVDAGRVKENRRDEINETPTLVECWVSRASAKQRRGRAGRVRPGIAYHLYSTHTHDNELTDYQLPEMLRVGIEDLVLQVLILDLGEPSTFLGKALNPPSNLAMSNSLKLLETLGAVECQWAQTPHRQMHLNANDKDSDQPCGELKVSSELTALGFHLATLPVDPRVGKLMIYGSLLGCVEPALTIAASMSSRSPFISPFDQRDAADEARKNFAVEGSDHLTTLNAFDQWKALKNSKKGNRVVNEFLKENFLGRLTLHQMEDLRNQFAKLLRDIGFLPGSFQLKQGVQTGANANSQNTGLIKAVLCAGLYPNILVAPRSLVATPGIPKKKGDKKVGECAFQSHRKGEVYLHPSTIAFDQSGLDSRYCCYHEIVKTSKTYARDTTTVSPFALLLFGGTLKVYQTHGVCSVDDWLKFRLDAKPATLVKYLRGQMERILLQKIVNPQDDAVESTEGRALIESISILFASKETLPVPMPEPDRSGGEIVRPWTGSDDPEERNRNAQPGNRGGQRGDLGGRSGRGSRGRSGGRGRGGRGSGRGGRR